MKRLILFFSLWSALGIDVFAKQNSNLSEGDYILVRHGEGINVDPEVVRLSKSKKGGWNLEFTVREVKATTEVHTIAKGSSEDQRHEEFVTTATVRADYSRVKSGEGWKVVSYTMLTSTLHGVIHENGSITGVWVHTYGKMRNPGIQRGEFILKPLRTEQDAEE